MGGDELGQADRAADGRHRQGRRDGAQGRDGRGSAPTSPRSTPSTRASATRSRPRRPPRAGRRRRSRPRSSAAPRSSRPSTTRRSTRSLEEDFDSELSGGELNLALAEQADDQTGDGRGDAADRAPVGVDERRQGQRGPQGQYQRAEREVMRDLSVDFQRDGRAASRASSARPRGRRCRQRGRELAETRSKDYMKDLKASYNDISVATNFDTLIKIEVSGYSQDEARERIDERRQAVGRQGAQVRDLRARHEREDHPRDAQGQVQGRAGPDQRRLQAPDRQRPDERPRGRPRPAATRPT